jgi:uncharacterized protein (TIGR00369 family)
MNQQELEAVLDEHSPRWRSHARITSLADRSITVTMPFQPELLRAGGTISGPSMMALADRAAYYLTLALVGPVPSAVTANLSIQFLIRPAPADIIATATMLRLGRRLAVSAVDLEVQGELVAHATVSYALPR